MLLTFDHKYILSVEVITLMGNKINDFLLCSHDKQSE